MDSQIIPHPPKAFLPNGFDATPENGFLYVSKFSIVYIWGIHSRADTPRVKIFHSKNFIRGLSCDPDWSESRYFAAFTNENIILVFDVTKNEPVLGHKAHLDDKGGGDYKTWSKSAFIENKLGLLCFTTNRRVYSIYNGVFINYCVRSNRWVEEKFNFNLNKTEPSIMKASPYDPNIVALGTRTGLIMIVELRKKTMLYTLWGHDTEIRSVDWMMVQTPKPKEKPIYFPIESINLKPLHDDTAAAFNLDCDRSNRTMDGSNRSVYTRESISSAEICEFRPEPEAISDVPQPVDGKVYLVSGAREDIWFWDIDNGTGIDKLVMNTPRQSKSCKSPAIIVSWVNESTVISTNSIGDLCEWKISFVSGGKIKIKMIEMPFIEHSVFAFSINKINRESQTCPLIWSHSFDWHGYCTRLIDHENIFVFGSTGPPSQCIAECPLDLNKIAIGCCDKRICIINVSNLKPNSIPIITLSNKIQNKVLALAWHPSKVHILAYSTTEGQVGLYDTTEPSNVPVQIKSFTGASVYTLSWGNIFADTKKSMYALFASDKAGKLVYIPDSGVQKHQPIPIKDITQVTEVSCSNYLLAAGTTTGGIIVLNLKCNFEVIHSEDNLAGKYISCISWNPINKNLLAISSEDGIITILDITKPLERRKLVGHALGIATVKWSNNSLNKLVSASFDSTVRVWDINTLTATSINSFYDSMFSAIFSPLDDNFIICAGYRDPLTIYDSRETTNNTNDIFEKRSKPKTGDDDIAMKWATQLDTVNSSKRKENRQNLKLDELSTKLETITVGVGDTASGSGG